MAVTFTNYGTIVGWSGNDAPDRNAYSIDTDTVTNQSWTPPTSGLLVCMVVWEKHTATATPALTGNGLTWIPVVEKWFFTNTVEHVYFAANAVGATTGANTLTFNGTVYSCGMDFFQVSGSDYLNGIAQTFVQSKGASGFSGTTATVTLDSGASDAANRCIASTRSSDGEDHVPRTNWTQLNDMYGSRLFTEYRADAFEQTASSTWATASNWNTCIAEIKAEVAGTSAVLDPFGMSGFFGA